jgi:hypothetical protein
LYFVIKLFCYSVIPLIRYSVILLLYSFLSTYTALFAGNLIHNLFSTFASKYITSFYTAVLCYWSGQARWLYLRPDTKLSSFTVRRARQYIYSYMYCNKHQPFCIHKFLTGSICDFYIMGCSVMGPFVIFIWWAVLWWVL